MTADAGSRGNLGNVDLEGGQQSGGQCRLRAFLLVELRDFAQVGQGLLDGVALVTVRTSGHTATSTSSSQRAIAVSRCGVAGVIVAGLG